MKKLVHPVDAYLKLLIDNIREVCKISNTIQYIFVGL